MRNFSQRNIGVQRLILRIRRIAGIVIIAAGNCWHYLKEHLGLRVLLSSPRLRPILQRNRATTRLLRKYFTARGVHAMRTALGIMVGQIIIIKQFLRSPLIRHHLLIGISRADLSFELLVLFDLILLLQLWIHIRLYWLLAITARLKNLRFTLLSLLSSCEGVKLTLVLSVVVLDAEDLVLRQFLARLSLKRLLRRRKRIIWQSDSLACHLASGSSTDDAHHVFNRVGLHNLIDLTLCHILFLGGFLYKKYI